MLTNHVALVAEDDMVAPSELTSVSAALQQQATHDFGPLWRVEATVDAFMSLDDVPLGYWAVIVRSDINQPGAAGVHMDQDGQPFALVQYSPSWSLTASHECLEMLADPFGKRLRAGPLPDQAQGQGGQGRVQYLVEVCDPCEDPQFAYTINGVLVSDFITPHYYDPRAAADVRYSFTGAIETPREVLSGGYVSWHDPSSDHWYQVRYFDGEPQVVDLGVMEDRTGSLREWIDRKTKAPYVQAGVPKNHPRLTEARTAQDAVQQSATAKAARWRQQINRLLQGRA
jgi:hypothetical protein